MKNLYMYQLRSKKGSSLENIVSLYISLYLYKTIISGYTNIFLSFLVIFIDKLYFRQALGKKTHYHYQKIKILLVELFLIISNTLSLQIVNFDVIKDFVVSLLRQVKHI